MMNKYKQTAKYLIADFVTATVVWLLLNILRFYELAQYVGYTSLASFLLSPTVIKGEVLIPLFLLAIYYMSGYYNQPFGKSRINELFNTFVTVSIGVIIVFFVVILNDLPQSFNVYYIIFTTYYVLQFFLTYICRLLITTHALRKVRRREWMLNALVIGTGSQALKIRDELQKLGYRIVGFVCENPSLVPSIPREEIIGNIDDLTQLMEELPVDELVLAMELTDNEETIRILYSLYHYKRPIKIRIEKNSPLSRAAVRTIHGIPLLDVTTNNFPEAAKNIKFMMDKVISLLFLTIFSPLYIIIAIRVKMSSKGPIFFSQERIGYMGRPFTIYKFRTMYITNADEEPLLTELNDPRVTPFGRFLRKYRLDEIPQFWNVLKGDMSLVGPRPEQRYYIDQIVRKAPYYYLLHNVRPGITSWGMVKYGYAENVDKMIERLNYDIMYYENMSLTLDITILVYTVKIVLTGKGV